jgi:hypothetical protein
MISNMAVAGYFFASFQLLTAVRGTDMIYISVHIRSRELTYDLLLADQNSQQILEYESHARLFNVMSAGKYVSQLS